LFGHIERGILCKFNLKDVLKRNEAQ